ncbi:MAG: TolC family protein [Chitinophagaceae bacterium]
MKQLIKYSVGLLVLLPAGLMAQQAPILPLDSVLQRIDRNNVLLQSYSLKAESYKYSADASTAWMPPMVGIGTFMTPYPGQKIMSPAERGNLMLQIEQDIPNRAKLNARRKYIESQGNIERATRDVTLNDFKAQAKRLYFNWLIAKQRMKVLGENEKIMVTMKKIEEVRYPYNQSQLGSVYKADAKIEENRNMIRMQEGTIGKARAWLNSLMNAQGNETFEIDTTYFPAFSPASAYDTASLSIARKDVLKMNESIRSMQLNIESMKLQRKPDFRIRFDNMYPLGADMPKAYNVMGMVSIPIVPWASKMYKSEVKAMQFNVQSMEKERAAMLQETQGMLYGMQYEIETMQRRIQSMEEKVIPALQKALDANFITYQENKMQLTQVIDAWEALTMMQMNVLDEKLKLYEMIVDYEKELYR